MRDGRYKMGSFRRLTGLTAETLRAWERRHALLEPVRGEGGHRLYTDDDLLVMRRVMRLMEEGRSIGEVARIGRADLLAASGAPTPGSSGQAQEWCSRIVASATRIDPRELAQALDETFAVLSPFTAVERVIIPAAREIGERWAAGEITVAGEHLVSAELTLRLHRLLSTAASNRASVAGVVCAGLPGEHHVLGLLIVSLALASASIPIVYLGADVPIADLDLTLSKVTPRALCLSVTQQKTLDDVEPELVRLANRWSDTVSLYVGGLGADGEHDALTRAGLVFWPSDKPLRSLSDEFQLRA